MTVAWSFFNRFREIFTELFLHFFVYSHRMFLSTHNFPLLFTSTTLLGTLSPTFWYPSENREGHFQSFILRMGNFFSRSSSY